jgi:hypothetical protein
MLSGHVAKEKSRRLDTSGLIERGCQSGAKLPQARLAKLLAESGKTVSSQSEFG